MRVKLTDICDFQGGSQPPKKEWSFENKDGYIRMLQIRDFTQTEKVTPEYIKQSKSTKICDQDDILIARYGASLGKILTGLSGAYNVAIMKTIPNAAIISKRYLYYFLKSKYFQNSILNFGSRAAQAGFNKEDLSQLNIECCSLSRQQEIVSTLDTLQSIITHRRTQLEKLDLLVKARFVEMFGDLVDNDKCYPIKFLSEIAEYWNGLTYKPEDVSEEGTIVLRSSNIQNSCLDFADTVRVSCKIGDKKYVKNNDILMCSRNGSARLVGKVALIENISEPMSFGAFMMIIRSNYYYYLMTYFQMPAFRRQIATGATTTINQITGNMLNKIKLPIPDMQTVEKFADFVKQVDKSKATVQKALDEAQLLFDSLMQEYFG